MALCDLPPSALLVLTCLRDLCGAHIPSLYDRGFCRLPQVRRSGTAPLIALLLCLRDVASGLPFSLSAGGASCTQPRVLLRHVTLQGVREVSELHWLLGERRGLNPVFVPRKTRQPNRRDTQTDSQTLLCIAPSAARPLYVTACWLPVRRPPRVVREFQPPSPCNFGWLSIQPLENSRRSFFSREFVSCPRPSNSSLQTSFLLVSGTMGVRVRLSLSSSPAAPPATTAARLRLRSQGFWSKYLPEASARASACPAAPLLRKSNFHRKPCIPAALRSFVEDEHNVNSLPEESFSAGGAEWDEKNEESQGMWEHSEEHSSKEKKDDFETAVSDGVLRDMVQRHFLYDEEEDAKMMHAAAPPFIIDGHRFNGSSPFACPPWGPMERMSPYDRSLASVPPLGDAAAAAAPSALGSGEKRNATERVHDFWDRLAQHTTNWDFYVESGSRVQGMANNAVLVTPPVTPNRAFLWTKHEIEQGAYEDPYADGTVGHKEPSYLNPATPAFRTGRRRDLHRRTDTGKKQKKRWGMENIRGDIPRGNWTFTDDIYKDMLDSVDWEREWPHLHDKNYYKRSHYNTLTGDNDRNEDSYWDPQFIGGVDTYPRVLPAGMNYTWPVYWVPWLCKKHPRHGGQPLKSEPFNLGGVEPLQLWFYPDGCELSHPGFCSVKLVSRPGWNLPFRIKMWIQGSSVDIPLGCRYSKTSAGAGEALCSDSGDAHPEREEEVRVVGGGDVGRTKNAAGHFTSQRSGRFISRVEVGPVRREEADYVAYSASFCRLLDKKSFFRLRSFPFPPSGDARPPLPVCYNPATDVVLRAAGDVDIGVAVAEENWEWDDGHWSVEQWLKLQSAYPDDLELEETLPASFTNSDMFENYKYRDVPDKHYAKYLPSALPPPLKGEDFDQMALNRRHAY